MGNLLSEMCNHKIHIVDSYTEFVVLERALESVSLIIIDLYLSTKRRGDRNIKKNKANPSVYFYANCYVTHLDEPFAKGIGQKYSVLDYIVKPFKSDRFIKSIKPLLIEKSDPLHFFRNAPVVQVSPIEYLEHQIQIAKRTKSSLSLIVISPSIK